MKIVPNNRNWCVTYSPGLSSMEAILINMSKNEAQKLADEWDKNSDGWTSYFAREQTQRDIEYYESNNKKYEYCR